MSQVIAMLKRFWYTAKRTQIQANTKTPEIISSRHYRTHKHLSIYAEN